jgi:hypothetical protein
MTKQKRDFAIAVGAIVLVVINTIWLIFLSANLVWIAQAIGRMR